MNKDSAIDNASLTKRKKGVTSSTRKEEAVPPKKSASIKKSIKNPNKLDIADDYLKRRNEMTGSAAVSTEHITIGKKSSKEDKLKIFGNNLRRLREQAGMPKKAVATAMGILPQQYYRYEDGVSEPGVIMATKLASMYGVDVQDLFEGLDDTDMRLLNAVRKLNEYGIKAEPSLTGEVYVEILGPEPVLLSLDAIEFLIKETLEDIKPSVQNNFANALQKNFLRHMQ